MNPVTRAELDAIRERQTAIANEMAALTRHVERLVQRCETEAVPEQKPAPMPAETIITESRPPVALSMPRCRAADFGAHRAVVEAHAGCGTAGATQSFNCDLSSARPITKSTTG